MDAIALFIGYTFIILTVLGSFVFAVGFICDKMFRRYRECKHFIKIFNQYCKEHKDEIL